MESADKARWLESDVHAYLSCLLDHIQVEFFPTILIRVQCSVGSCRQVTVKPHVLPGSEEGMSRHFLMDLVQVPQPLKDLQSKEHQLPYEL